VHNTFILHGEDRLVVSGAIASLCHSPPGISIVDINN